MYAQYRILQLSGELRRADYYRVLLVIVVGLAIYFMSGLFGTPAWYRLIVGAAGAGLYALFLVIARGYMFRRRIRRFVKKARGTDDVLPCEIVLDQNGLSWGIQNQEFSADWSTVVGFEENDDYLEIIMDPLGILVLKKDDFENEELQAEWRDYILEHAGLKG